MKKVWKWIIGIVAGLVILAVLMGVAFLVRGNMHGYGTEEFGYRDFNYRGPGYFQPGPGMMPYGGYNHMGGYGMMGYGFSPFGGLFGGLVSLVFLALVVLGVIWLVNRLRAPRPYESSTVVAATMSPAAIAGVTHPCQKCGRPLQNEWNVCPYCGKKV